MAEYVVSDIHGQYNRFMELLDKSDFNMKNDHLYVIGDVIDRGPKSLKIIDFIKKNSEHITFIKGNHELFAEQYIRGELPEILWESFGGKDTIEEIKKLTNVEKLELATYFMKLPYYVEIETPLGETILAHTGMMHDCIKENKDGDILVKESIDKSIEKSPFDYLVGSDMHYCDPRIYKHFDRYLICGHVPTSEINRDGSNKMYFEDKFICIDCGAGYIDEGGTIGMLRLDDMTEFYLDEETADELKFPEW